MEVYTCKNGYRCIKNLVSMYDKDYIDDYLKQTILNTAKQVTILREKENKDSLVIKNSYNQDVINHLNYNIDEYRQNIKMLCKKLKCLEQIYLYFVRQYCV